MSAKKFSLRELDFNNMGSWPQQAKVGFCVIIALLIVFLSWWLFVRDKLSELEGLEMKETELRQEFETKQGRAANLEPLKQQLAQMEEQLKQMLRQLPSKTEMPDLIVDISQTALATGITNELFQPGPEIPKEFYAEKPIALRMVGTYHQFGGFVSGVATLPRVVIMTMHDISLKPRDKDKNGKAVAITPNSPLELAGTVKTYRYLDEEEVAEQEQAAKAQGGTPPATGTQGGADMLGHSDRMSTARNRILLGAVLVVALVGCTRGITSTPGEAPNLEKWVAEVKARPAPPLDPLPVMQQFETFEYAAYALRDPFSTAFTDSDTGSGPRPDRQRRRQTLEQFPLDSVDMVGTLGRGAGVIALVMAPDKVTYRVRPGDYMGQNDGRVTGVFEDRIELVELVPDGAGGWLERPASVALEDQ